MSHPVHRMALDLSHHNTVSDWGAVKGAGIVGIIHKASEGTYMVDDQYRHRRDEAKRHGLLWGAYHFATSNDAAAQADWFLNAADLGADDLFCLDWEDYGASTMSKGQAEDWMKVVEGRLGRICQCVVYSGNVAKEELGEGDRYFGERRLWLAQYSTSPVVEPPWTQFWLWQYSDGQYGPGPHGCPGVSGYVDTNSYDGTVEELKATWATGQAGVSVPPVAEGPRVVRITIAAPADVEVVVNQVGAGV